MTRDDMIRLAHEAGWGYANNQDGYDPLWKFGELVAAAEREACAGLEISVIVPTRDYSTMTPLDCYEAGLMDQAMAFRTAIRARNKE